MSTTDGGSITLETAFSLGTLVVNKSGAVASWGDPTDLEVREILRLLSFDILWSSQKHF